jgi:LysM repeat protein
VNGKSSAEVVPAASRKFNWVSGIAWLITFGFMAVAGYLGWERWGSSRADSQSLPTEVKQRPIDTISPQDNHRLQTGSFPAFQDNRLFDAIQRRASLFTNIPNRPRRDVLEYTVSLGDSVFGIAQEYNLQPETVLWSNYDVLKDNPHAVSAGMVLKIPPTNGIYYKWKEDDTLESVAAAFKTDVAGILNWPGNRLDLTNPKISPGSWVMIPDGAREFQQWIVPVMPRGAAGVSTGIYGGGACPGGYDGLYGSGAFIWPTINRTISGNDYWSGHLAIDIGAALGEPISAADSGVVVFAGWAAGGYGYTAAIDHGNGYQTLYAHLSSVRVSCGQSVVQGQTIGYGGSTGNSTGPHLHFEIRYQGGFVNPWYVLPAP